MDYQLKPEIKFGSINKIVASINSSTSVLVITSKSLNKINQIQKIFDAQNYKVISDVEPELPFSYVRKLYQSIKISPDLIIAIGGGSVIDLGKALSVANDFEALKALFDKQNTTYNKYTKLISFPTTFGTGAETSFGSILYDDLNKKKGGLRSDKVQSDIVIIDPNLYLSAPQKLMAETGFDCFTHAFETYLSRSSNAIVKYQSLAAIRIIFDELETAVTKKDKNSISKMAIASMMMGVNLAFSTTCLPHRIQYIIGPMTNTSHAQGLIMLYKGWLKLIEEQVNENMQIQDLLKDLKMTFKDLKGKINDLISLNKSFTLKNFGITDSDIEDIARSVHGNLENDPFYKNLSSIQLILEESL
mgnify:FL=1